MTNRSENSPPRAGSEPGRVSELLRALNGAAALLQQSAPSEADVFRIFRSLLLKLGFYGTLALLDEDKQNLVLRAVVYSPKLLTLLEKTTSLRAEGASYPLSEVEVSHQVIDLGQPVFLPDTTETICQIVPAAARSVVKTIVQLSGPHSGIYAPLVIKDKVLGLLNMSSKDLTAADIPAVMALAYHISVALENSRLVKEMGKVEARYRRLFETAGDALLLLDTETARILSANNKAKSLLGYPEAELLSMPLPALLPPRVADDVRHLICATLDQEQRIGEFPLIRSDGQRLTVSISATCFDSGGRLLTQCVVRDVTEHGRAELRQSATYRIATIATSDISLQELYRLIHGIIGESMDVSNFYIAIFDKETDMIKMPYFVDEMEPAPAPYKAKKGLTEYVIRTGEPLLITGKGHAGLIRQAQVELIGEPAPIWLGVPLKSREETFGAIVVQHYRDGQAYTEREKHFLEFVSGQIASSIMHKQSETALKQSEERFRKVFEEGPLGMSVVTLDGRFREVNATFCHITGYSERELDSLSVLDIFAIEEQELNRNDIEQLLSGVAPYIKAERRIERRHGGPRCVNITASTVRDEQGQPLYLLFTLEDISERKEAEYALRHAQKMKSLGVLAGGVAHDFNNLLVAMLGQSSLALAKLSADHPARLHVTKTVNAAEMASELTRQLLAYSGRGQFIMQSLDLNEVLHQNLHLLEAAIPKNVTLEVDLAESLPAIEADMGQIQQVVMNLILNAAEAIGSLSGVVWATTKVFYLDEEDGRCWEGMGQALPPDAYVMLAIRDNGPGMDDKTLSRIFDPFFTTKQSGRGLGLAAVLGIVQGHGAGLRVTSEVGQGTTFEILFPLCKQVEKLSDTALLSMPTTGARRGKLLVIDDERFVREAVTDILEMGDIEVISAENGMSGISLYQAHATEIDLVLLDLSMPGLNGEETLDELQRIDPKVKVILSSGFSKAEMSRRFAGKGLVDFVPKPYSADRLESVVNRHLHSRANGIGLR